LVTGSGCLTDFLLDPLELDVPDGLGTGLYSWMTKEIEDRPDARRVTVPSCTVVEWDWWNIHLGVAATAHEWQFLIRVAETDERPPTDWQVANPVQPAESS